MRGQPSARVAQQRNNIMVREPFTRRASSSSADAAEGLGKDQAPSTKRSGDAEAAADPQRPANAVTQQDEG